MGEIAVDPVEFDVWVEGLENPHVIGPDRLSAFFERIDFSTGCWNWTGSTNNKGYGAFSYSKVKIGAHRLSLILHKSEPENKSLVAMHSCNNPGCVNPAHLSWGTQSENLKQMVESGRQVLGEHLIRNLEAEECPRGHSLEGENLDPRDLSIGWRNCLACHRARSDVNNRRKRGLLRLDFGDVSNAYFYYGKRVNWPRGLLI